MKVGIEKRNIRQWEYIVVKWIIRSCRRREHKESKTKEYTQYFMPFLHDKKDFLITGGNRQSPWSRRVSLRSDLNLWKWVSVAWLLPTVSGIHWSLPAPSAPATPQRTPRLNSYDAIPTAEMENRTRPDIAQNSLGQLATHHALDQKPQRQFVISATKIAFISLRLGWFLSLQNDYNASYQREGHECV